MRVPVRLTFAVVASVVLLCSTRTFAADDVPPEVMKVARAYLDALAGSGDEGGRELLLGGATMNAQLFTLENWKILDHEALRSEDGELASATKLMSDLDSSGREALTKLLGETGAGGDEMSTREFSQEEATKVMAPTRRRAQKFLKAHPVLAYATRVGKEVYWHPKNPMRPLLAKSGTAGRYHLELYLFHIQTVEGPRKVPRVWPLRVLRFKAGKVDTGWRVLPASDWNAE